MIVIIIANTKSKNNAIKPIFWNLVNFYKDLILLSSSFSVESSLNQLNLSINYAKVQLKMVNLPNFNLIQMLTAEQKIQAELKLKSIQAEAALEDELKENIKRTTKIILNSILSLNAEPKLQIDVLKKLTATTLLSSVGFFEQIAQELEEVEHQMKADKDKIIKDRFAFSDEKERLQQNMKEIQNTIGRIKKSVKESIEEEEKKRAKMQADLEVSLQDIRGKIATFEAESAAIEVQNAELKIKYEAIRAKIDGIPAEFQKKAIQKDEIVRQERDELTEKLRAMEAEVTAATELNKEFSLLEKKNFDRKLSLYLRTKKLGECPGSMESTAKTIQSCKEELLKGVQRLTVANETIEIQGKRAQTATELYIAELKRQGELQARAESVKQQKEAIRMRIMTLQGKIKEKGNAK